MAPGSVFTLYIQGYHTYMLNLFIFANPDCCTCQWHSSRLGWGDTLGCSAYKDYLNGLISGLSCVLLWVERWKLFWKPCSDGFIGWKCLLWWIKFLFGNFVIHMCVCMCEVWGTEEVSGGLEDSFVKSLLYIHSVLYKGHFYLCVCVGKHMCICICRSRTSLCGGQKRAWSILKLFFWGRVFPQTWGSLSYV